MNGRVLITGDRNWTDEELIYNILRVRAPNISSICHGGARGADSLASRAAKRLGIRRFIVRADWDTYGRRAGPIRNSDMLRRYRPTVVYAFHDHIEDSKGTRDMILKALRAEVPVLLITHKRMRWFNERREAKIFIQNTAIFPPEEGVETDTRFRWSRWPLHGNGDGEDKGSS